MAPRLAATERLQSTLAKEQPASSSSSTTTTQPSPTPVSPSPSSRFSYSIAASYIAKDHPFDASKHIFHFNPYNRVQQQPRQQQRKSRASRPRSGQDAFFVSRIGNGTGAVALGVADGVGGWMDSGVDPADFSHGFCDYAAAEAYGYEGKPSLPSGRQQKNNKLTPALPSARELMQRGYDAVCHDPTIPAGGSTATVAVLGGDGDVEIANLGDSGYVHLRLGGVHGHSSPQTHAFNTPYQLSAVPPSVMLRVAAFGGAQLSDTPSDADVTRLRVRHGDVVVFATDGMWDNLFDQDVLRLVSRSMTGLGAWSARRDSGMDVAPDLDRLTRLSDDKISGRDGATTLQGLLATSLVGAAKAASVNTRVDGPFAKEVKKYYPLDNWRGGKVDDICVVVVVVSENDRPVKARL